MESLIQDFKFGIRTLAKNPGFTFVAVVALALGIGANTAIFSVINAVLLSPLKYKDPDKLVRISSFNYPKNALDSGFSFGRFQHMQEQIKGLDGFAAFAQDNVALTTETGPEQLQAARVSSTMFQVLRAVPAVGRDFLPEEDTPGGNLVTILSHNLWQQRFGADPNIIGKSLNMDGGSFTVVGVMPADFHFPDDATQIWLPKVFELSILTPTNVKNGATFFNAIGRLKSDVPLQQAQREMDIVTQQYRDLGLNNIDSDPNTIIRLNPLKEQLVQNVKPTLLILFVAVGFVLLIACANVANLLLARGAARYKEIALRTALGASRMRIVRQLLTEAVVLSLIGGGVGLLLAYWGVSLLSLMNLDNIPRSNQIGIDRNVLVFSLVVSLFTGVFFGLIPALRASRPDLNETLKDGGKGGTESLARNRIRGALVIIEVALSLVLLIGAGLLIQSFARLQQVRPGFDTQNLLTMRIILPTAKYSDTTRQRDFFAQVIQKVKMLPGVRSVATGFTLPIVGNVVTPYLVEGQPQVPVGDRLSAEAGNVSIDYFKTMGIPLLSGRIFDEHDRDSAQKYIMINNKLAKLAWPNEDPVGKRLFLGRLPDPFQVIGVVADVKTVALNAEPTPMFYYYYDQRPFSSSYLVVKTNGDPMALSASVRAQVLSVDSQQPVTNVQSMEQVLSASVSQAKMTMSLLGIFAVLALVLAGVGIYGVMSYSVSQRTREIGIRMALGAQQRDIMKLVVGQSMVLALIGVVVGVVGTFGLTGLMTGLLYDIRATDPRTFLFISLFLVGVAAVAGYLPARRASKVDPLEAMRY